MKLIIDAHCWISYLEGSSQGEKVNQILKEDNEIFVLPITISEVVSKVKRMNKDMEIAYSSIINHSSIFEVSPKIAKEAGLLHAETRKRIPNFGIVDALLITAAKNTGAKVLTGDNHFKGFKEAILL